MYDNDLPIRECEDSKLIEEIAAQLTFAWRDIAAEYRCGLFGAGLAVGWARVAQERINHPEVYVRAGTLIRHTVWAIQRRIEADLLHVRL